MIVFLGILGYFLIGIVVLFSAIIIDDLYFKESRSSRFCHESFIQFCFNEQDGPMYFLFFLLWPVGLSITCFHFFFKKIKNIANKTTELIRKLDERV